MIFIINVIYIYIYSGTRNYLLDSEENSCRGCDKTGVLPDKTIRLKVQKYNSES